MTWRNKEIHFYSGRFLSLILLLALIAILLIWRMVDLSIINRAFLLKEGDARTVRILEIPAYRGMITDRRGEPLAISTPVDAVWVNPSDVNLADPALNKLAQALQIPAGTLRKRLKKNATREFLYLKRGINPTDASQISALKIPGVYLQREFHRFYPEAEVASHIVGFTNIDDLGQEGIELSYNQWLQGHPGRVRVLKDRVGRIIDSVKTLEEPSAGHDLVLSIDRRIQYMAYQALKIATKEFQAQSAEAVVLDARTGEVLAIVNQPSYNPNNRYHINVSNYRNRAVTDLYEPGSVIKTFGIASALETGKYHPHTPINTVPGWLNVSGNVVRDEHYVGETDVTGVLKYSSNVGMSKMVLSQPPENLWNELTKVGFGVSTQSGFPGESAGALNKQAIKRPFSLATLSFGYGLAVTPLQLARAYSVFANHGVLMPISLVKRAQPPQGERVMSAQVADEMLTMLQEVVRDGSGVKAQIPGYGVGGKTGTSRLLGANGYEKNHHVATFVGIAPTENPRLIVVVSINDPASGGYYGAQVAAPVFARITGAALRMLNVLPTEPVQNKRIEHEA